MRVQENKPLYSFEDSGDYVSDVRWSPVHPALFASVDASGRLDLWNLNRDTEVLYRRIAKHELYRLEGPITILQLAQTVETTASVAKRATFVWMFFWIYVYSVVHTI
jgi:WD40 repeat protein